MSSRKLRFDGWVFEPESGDLERQENRIRLQEQPARVLQELIAHAGSVVTREQLVALLWPTGIVDFDTSLNTAVRKLRSALGDVAETPRYVETLPRRGYRFIGALDPDPELAPSAARAQVAVSVTPVPRGSEPTGPAALQQPLHSSAPASISTDHEPAARDTAASTEPPPRRAQLPAWALIVAIAAAALLIGLLAKRFWLPPNGASSPPHVTASETAAVMPPGRPVVSATSIAVLPFVDMSERKDQEYFSDGLSEELIELLGRTPGLRVTARTSTFYFKGKAEKLETIAQELRVANVLEGSVRKDGNRLRVTAQLIRVATSEHLWSETFDRDLHDVFKVQDEVAAAVVSALKVHLLPAQPAALHLGTASLEAYNQFLMGKQSYNQGDPDGYRRAVTAFRAAIALDPGYAPAYASLALAQWWAADLDGNTAEYDSAVEAADKAVELGPEQAASYATRGFLRAISLYDFSGAQADLNKAVALNPGDADVLHRSAVVLGILGDLPAAISREQQALALDPLSAEICMRLGFFLAANQQLALARPLYEKSLAIAENSIRTRFNLGELELLENRPAQALAAFQQNKSDVFRLVGEAKAEYSLGHLDASQRALDELKARYGSAAVTNIATVYAWRGEKDQAFAWAERAYAQRDAALTWIKIDTSFHRLHSEPRYHALLRKMNLPDD